MHFTTIASALLSGAALTAALPTAAENGLKRRACSVQYPTHVFQIKEDEPNINTGDHGYVYTAQEAGPSHRWVTELQFADIPEGAYGCSVELFFQQGYRGLTTSGNNKLDFFTVDRDVDVTKDTWLNAPNKASLVGTQAVNLAPQGDTKLTAVSAACNRTLNYRVEIEGAGAGSVGFFQGEPNGFRLTYNC